MSKKKAGKLSRRITWRVITIISLFNVIIIGVILFVVLYMSLFNSAMRGHYVTDGIGGKMETMLRTVSIVAANNVSELKDDIDGDSPEMVFDALEQVLQVNEEYVGCFAAFEPDYFKSYGRWFEPNAYYVGDAEDKRIERRQLGSAEHDYFSREWYQKALAIDKQREGYLTDPYYDYSVDSSLYCSYVMPLHNRQGQKVGVYGIDLNINWVNKAMDEQENSIWKEFFSGPIPISKIGDEVYFSIQVIDSKGRLVVGSDSLDISILKGRKMSLGYGIEMQDLRGTPYFVNTKHLHNTGWTLYVIQHYKMVFLWGRLLGIVIVLVMCLGGIVIFLVMSKSIRRATKPLGFLTDSAHEVAKGNFDTPLPKFEHRDEVTRLRNSFAAMQVSLKQYVSELKSSTAAKASMESELNIAHNIQMSMLPKSFPPFPQRKDIDLYASLTPAKAVGGDLYDFFIRDEKLFFCIGDVSGKGVPASLVMAVTRTLFRNISAHTAAPSHIVWTMNQNISEGNDNDMFVTLIVGVLDLASGHLSYCNAGHNPPVLAGQFLPVEPNVPVGMVPDWNYVEQELMMTSGSMLFLYTDGLTEAENASHELFGEERAMSVVKAQDDDFSSQEIVEAMTAAVHEYVSGYEQSDDLTMMAVKWIDVVHS